MAGDHLDPRTRRRLRRHYGLTHGGGRGQRRSTPGRDADAGPSRMPHGRRGSGRRRPRHAAAGTTPRCTASDGAMTRSEEQLRVGTERVATTRARLVKYVVTEDVQITVPIRREEIRVEQVPIDEPDGSDDVARRRDRDRPAPGSAGGCRTRSSCTPSGRS